MTGQQIDLAFDWKIDKAFSGYVGPAEKNRLFRNVLFYLADKKWFGLDNQKDYDELSSLVSTQDVFNLNSNQISTAPIIVSNIVPGIGILTITSFFPHNLIAGDRVTINSIQGVTFAPPLAANITVQSVTSPTVFVIPYAGVITGTYTQYSANFTTSKMVYDYMHLFACKAKFLTPCNDVTISSTAIGSPIRVTTKYISSLRTGDKIDTSGFSVATANGSFYVKVINSKQFDLYSQYDGNTFSGPSSATTAGTAQGVVSRETYNYTTPVYSDRKIDAFGWDVNSPGIETANKRLKIYPLNRTCPEITLDYMKVPTSFVDVNDNVLDLDLVYSGKFMYLVVATAADLYATPSHDQLLHKDMQIEIMQNP